MNLNQLIKHLEVLLNNKTSSSETWGSLTITGTFYSSAVKDMSELSTYLKDVAKVSALTIKIDNASVSSDELVDYSMATFASWNVHVNKVPLIFKDSQSNYWNNFFCELDSLERWIDKLDAFDPENPFHKYSPLKIVASNMKVSITGLYIQILPPNKDIVNIPQNHVIPDTEKINEIVHVLSDKEICISPKTFVISDGLENISLREKLLKLSSLSLAASIVNEFHSGNKVVIDGIKRVNLQLYNSTDRFSDELNNKLLKAVEWIYSDKVSTRLKLFLDRLTIELNDDNSIVHELNIHLESALNQAEQRYNFVILERKDKYLAELKDLLKDIRTQSDLYSLKIRTLLNNLLRDILAAIVLIGFTVFTKFSDNLELDKAKLLSYVFTGLAAYYVFSIVFQTIVDIIDVQVSKKEMLYWKNTTKELLPEKDFKNHIDKSLKGRRLSLRVIYPLIFCTYIFVAILCYEFPKYFNEIIITKPTNDKVYKSTTPADSCSQGRK